MARSKKDVSRRAFLKGAGAGAAALGAGIAAAAPKGPKVLGRAKTSVNFELNGKKVTVDVEPRVTLLNALRNNLDTTGPKKICDRGTCGGCAVILDGKPVVSCMMLAVDADGATITTVEGIGEPGKLHALQEAFLDADALQCGFCTAGMIVGCKSLLDANKSPKLGDVKAALAGHICRCGTYPRIFEACLKAAEKLR